MRQAEDVEVTTYNKMASPPSWLSVARRRSQSGGFHLWIARRDVPRAATMPDDLECEDVLLAEEYYPLLEEDAKRWAA